MKTITGIFVTTKGKEESLKIFELFSQKYQHRVAVNDKQRLEIFRAYCNDAKKVIETCFVHGMWGSNRCVKRILTLQQHATVNNAYMNQIEVLNIMMELKNIIRTAIPIIELPSCKGLIELSVTDAISAMNDLGKNNIVKIMICSMLLGKNISDNYKISDIENFYISQIKELEREVAEEKREMNDTESFLMDKFYAEICYCYKARLKTGIGITKEVYSIVRNADQKNRKYEGQISSQDYSNLIK